MKTPKKPPSYLKNSSSSGAYARTILLWPGGRREVRSLGVYGSPSSHEAHQRAVAEWRAAWGLGTDPEANYTAPPGSITVEEVVARYWSHIEKSYPRRQDQRHGGQDNIRYALRPLRRMFGPLPVAEFGPKKLKLLRQALATGEWLNEKERKRREKESRPLGMSRKGINQRVDYIRRVFRWAVEEELIPAEWADRLAHVRPLRAGEYGLRDNDEVPPVPEADLEKTLVELPRIVRAMADVQLLTGARPGEIVRLRPCDLLRTGEVDLGKGIKVQAGKCWVVIPQQHKGAWRNHKRIIFVGPKAQEILQPFLAGRADDVPLFSPAEATAERIAALRVARKSKVQPSQADRSVKGRRKKKEPGTRYSVGAYNQAVKRACARTGVPEWHVNQLRHSAATRLVEQFGWAIAQIVLGHRHQETTAIYAMADLKKAADALGKVG